jgi:pimeloyl-ACP methyl ester carboxylesterase/DNA-binding SARP family transcriptional activator
MDEIGWARAMNGQLEIGVLGELRVARDGKPVSLPRSKKTRALLAFLVVSGRPQRRERLCDLFWEVPDDPRGALRWSLSKIRQVVNAEGEDRIEAEQDNIFIRTDDVDLDLRRVTQLNSSTIETADIPALEAAVSAFRGGFLENLYFPSCPEFEAWRTSNANELEILRIRILRTLVNRLSGQPERALLHAHALQALSPEDESLIREIEGLASAARTAAFSPPAAPVQPATDVIDDTVAGSKAFTSKIALDLPAPDELPSPWQDIRFCNARDGVRIAYAVCGRGPPIIRAAHWMSHLQFDLESPVWRHWIRGLSEQNTLIRYDERCCGLSSWDEVDVSFDAMVSDLETIVDTVGLDRFALLGVSQSCAVSVAYAIRHPERVSHLILYGGYVRGWRKRGNPQEIATREALNVLMRAGWGQEHVLFRQLFTSLFIPDAKREQLEWLNELQLKTLSPENAYRLQDCFGDTDVSGLLADVAVPTLVIHARKDAVAPIGEGRSFAAGIPGARFVELDSANHILLDGEPAFREFLREVRAFIGEDLSRARPAPQPEPMRRQISVLAVEIVSPYFSIETSDPETAVAFLDPLTALVLNAVERNGGTVLSRDDATMVAVFGVGTASENHAWRACRTALAVKGPVERAAQGAARVRAAIDTGDAFVRTRAFGAEMRVEASGLPVRVVRQLLQALKRSVIAATARVNDATSGCIRSEPLASNDYPTFPRDQQIFEVIGEQ